MLQKSIGWITLIVILTQVVHLSRKNSLDQNGRNLVAAAEVQSQAQNDSSTQTLSDPNNLQTLKALSLKMSKQN